MNYVKYVWKPIGLTPLEAIEKLRLDHPELYKEKISYAGRLDPMAEGILILLIGEENKNRDKYLGLKKEYESEIIFGISTDSNDGLGLIEKVDYKEIDKNEIEKTLKELVRKQSQKYPVYSSKTVKGKPLFWWARNNKLNEINIPSKKIEIYSIEILEFKNIAATEMVDTIINNIKKVNGDFRQIEIINNWQEFLINNQNKEFQKIKIKISCSSGTYVRQIANELGEKLGTAAFAYSIKRTAIGIIKEKDCLV